MPDDDLRFGDVDASSSSKGEPLTEKLSRYMQLTIQIFVFLVILYVVGRVLLQMMEITTLF